MQPVFQCVCRFLKRPLRMFQRESQKSKNRKAEAAIRFKFLLVVEHVSAVEVRHLMELRVALLSNLLNYELVLLSF